MSTRRTLMGVLTLALLTSILLVLGMIRGQNNTTTADAEHTSNGPQASLQRFTLGEMVDRAGRIFRGTVVDFQPGTVEAGGGSLPTVTYKFRVTQIFKGEVEEKGRVKYAEVTMLGSIKADPKDGAVKKFNTLPSPTRLEVGSDYLMILTPESKGGLTAPVGLGQGSFEIFQKDKTEFAKNEFNNMGLFKGPIEYSALAAEIQRKGGNK